jgi:predicted membrane channel-forming protein YqfA (hemolysin III family)
MTEANIESGYRINFVSFTLAMASLLQWHNETVNVWTHLLGCLTFICLVVYVILLPVIYEGHNEVPIWPLVVHCSAAIIQMGASF